MEDQTGGIMKVGIKDFENGGVRWWARRRLYRSRGLGNTLGEGKGGVSSGHHRSKGQPYECSQNQVNNWEIGAYL